MYGARSRIRTEDHLITNQVHYHCANLASEMADLASFYLASLTDT